MPIVKGDNPSTPADKEILRISNQLLRLLAGQSTGFAMAALAQTFLFTMEELQRDGSVPEFPALFRDAGEILTQIVDEVRSAAATTRES